MAVSCRPTVDERTNQKKTGAGLPRAHRGAACGRGGGGSGSGGDRCRRGGRGGGVSGLVGWCVMRVKNRGVGNTDEGSTRKANLAKRRVEGGLGLGLLVCFSCALACRSVSRGPACCCLSVCFFFGLLLLAVYAVWCLLSNVYLALPCAMQAHHFFPDPSAATPSTAHPAGTAAPGAPRSRGTVGQRR